MTERHRDGSPSDDPLADWATKVLPRAVAYARTLLRRSADAEDVVHDVLCRLLRHEEYDLVNDGEKLLFRSVTNACINRTVRRKRIVSLDAADDGEPSLASSLAQSKAPDPSETASADELHEAIGRGLAELPAMQRAAIELKAMGHSLKTIAETLSVSPSNAGVLVHRARRALALRLGNRLDGNLIHFGNLNHG